MDYNVSDDVRRNPSHVANLLVDSVSASLEVERYWRDQDASRKSDCSESWTPFIQGGQRLEGWSFHGPGCMSIQFGERVAEIRSGARWRGWLTIPPLRQVHLAAFVAIGRAVGSTRMLYAPDYAEELHDAMDEGQSLDECERLMTESWGSPQDGLKEIHPRVLADCEHCPPRIWFLEPI